MKQENSNIHVLVKRNRNADKHTQVSYPSLCWHNHSNCGVQQLEENTRMQTLHFLVARRAPALPNSLALYSVPYLTFDIDASP